jgi:hypothetical protein
MEKNIRKIKLIILNTYQTICNNKIKIWIKAKEMNKYIKYKNKKIFLMIIHFIQFNILHQKIVEILQIN